MQLQLELELGIYLLKIKHQVFFWARFKDDQVSSIVNHMATKTVFLNQQNTLMLGQEDYRRQISVLLGNIATKDLVLSLHN